MVAASLWVGVLTSALASASVDAPVLWSPDGRWVAYTTNVPKPAELLSPWWLFEPGAPDRAGIDPKPDEDRLDGRSTAPCQLWVTDAANQDSTLLAQSAGAISSPSWNADGTALCFVRLTPVEPQTARYEVVIQDVNGPRVLLSETVTGLANDAQARVAGAGVAWSPDGRHIAAPRVQPFGLVFIRADNGHPLKSIEGAFQPAWSADGAKVAFYRSGAPESLCWMDANFGEPRRLADAPQASLLPAPAWSRDGRTVLFIRRGTGAVAWAGAKIQAAELVRVRVENSTSETIRTILHEPMTSADMFRAASYSFDTEGEEFFYTTSTRGQKSQITLAMPNGVIRKRFNPFDEAVPLGSLAFSPSSRRLALRVGATGPLGGPALCDPETEHLTLLTPDDGARANWLAAIVGTARMILVDMPARNEPKGPVLERPSLLPTATELAMNGPAAIRLRRLGRIGRELCETRPESARDRGTVTVMLEQGSLFCAYLSGDYATALASLDELESRPGTPEIKRRLLALRAQISLARDERDDARATVEYLKGGNRGPSHQLEETPAGPVLSPLNDPIDGWLDYLARQIDERTPEDPNAPPNPPSGASDPDDNFEPVNAVQQAGPAEVPAGVVPMPPVRRVIPPRASRRPVQVPPPAPAASSPPAVVSRPQR